MDNWLKRKWVIRVLSLLMAILLYTSVTLDDNQYQSNARIGDNNFGTSQEAQTVNDVPVNIKIDEEKYVVSGVPETVTVILEGSSSIATPVARQRNFDVFVDLENLETGTHTVPITYTGISDSLTVYIEPSEVEVTIEERAVESFDVSVEYLNRDQLEAGYELGDVEISPAQVQITSSRSVVDRVAIVKAIVNLQGANESIRLNEVPIKVYDNQGNELNVRVQPSTVEVSVEINSPNSLIPVEVTTTGQLPDDLTIQSISTSPGEIRVYAPEEVLANLDKLTTQPIDLSTITDQTTLEVDLVVPENIRRIDEDHVTVNIEVARIVERTIENVPITVQGLEEGFSLSFVSPNEGITNIKVIGTEELVNNLLIDDIILSISAFDTELGEHELPIQIVGPDDIKVEPEQQDATVLIE